ncbi:glycosyltransferase family 39 protein [Candidatus Nitrotoga sp. 1052]|uniref:glycosyltransferase family 39 protein n=1 Tax=Candidatus Nitrotoga sp. 1052 TaxID=2886964 RepID=UPI001EF58612|nr:glycosyltransferase family 39 protein [Candidatus Nitrotoga sp. 1052]CAH1087217.1 conserved membrane hypothetical protein [Candidatus Nitrotoga sp. 1052]
MPHEANSRFSILFALTLAVLIWALATVTAQVRFPIGNDAIGYMVSATNLLKGQGITSVVNETESPDLDYAPTRYQPPGFALTIAGLSALGLSVENAAFAFSRLSWALLPMALLFAMRPILPFAWAAAVTALAVFSPGIYLYGSTVNTDVPTLLLIVLATGFMVRGVAERPRIALLLSAGIILGLAYALRNSVTAAFAGMVAALIGASLLRLMPVSSAAKNCGWILLGSAPVIGLLLLRNYLVFGEVQPYVLMVGTDATLLESFRVYLHGLLWDITGSPTLARYLAWDFKILVLTAAPTAGLLTWGLTRHWRNAGLPARFAVLYGLLYSGAGAAMLVIAHTYHGLDFHYLLRHMMQYVWILFALMVVALLALGDRKAKLLTGLLVAILLASRLWFIVDDLRTEHTMQEAFSRSTNIVEAAQPFLANGRILTDQIKQRLAKDATIPAAVRALPGDALILSNQGQLLAYFSGRPVRTLPFPSESNLSIVTGAVSQVFRDMRRNRPVYVVLVPDNHIVRSPDGANWQDKIASRLPVGYQVVGREVNLLIFLAHPPSNGVKSQP